MLESNALAARQARKHYGRLERPEGREVQVRQAHVTVENINETIVAAGATWRDRPSFDRSGWYHGLQKKRLTVATVEQQFEAIRHLDFVEI